MGGALSSKLWGVILGTGLSFRADGRWTLWAIQRRHTNFGSWKVNSITVTALAKEKEVDKSTHAATWRDSEMWCCHEYLSLPT